MQSLYYVVPDVNDIEQVDYNVAGTLSVMFKEDFHSELELQLNWDPLHKKPEKDFNKLRFTVKYNEYSSPGFPMPDNFPSELQPVVKKMPWKNVYGKLIPETHKCKHHLNW